MALQSPDPMDAIAEAVNGSIFARNGIFVERMARDDGELPEIATSVSPPLPSTRVVLAEHWKFATQELVGDSPSQRTDYIGAVMSDWFERLWTMHTERTRHYHTVVHLEEMCHYFQLVRALQGQLGDNFPADSMVGPEYSFAVLLAIFFHDAVYDAKSLTNEEDSATLFLSFADEAGIDQHKKQLIKTYILATKKHEASQESGSPALSLFLDLDMAVLGKQEEAYIKYAALIREEFSFVPHEIYCEKRADILETFLKQTRIYGTSVMFNALEDRARANLLTEVASLRNGVIPCSGDDE